MPPAHQAYAQQQQAYAQQAYAQQQAYAAAQQAPYAQQQAGYSQHYAGYAPPYGYGVQQHASPPMQLPGFPPPPMGVLPLPLTRPGIGKVCEGTSVIAFASGAAGS